MRNPYNKYYDEYDEICIVENPLELQTVMNFMMTFDINSRAFPFDRGVSKHRALMVPKGDLTKIELKEARDSCSGVLWALRLPAHQLTAEYKELLKKQSF